MMPGPGDVPVGEYIDYTELPERPVSKKPSGGLLKSLPFVLVGVFLFFLLRKK